MAVLVVVVGSVVVIVTGVRGADYPGQYLRAELWREAGFAAWNNYWYAGHPIINYSLITPALMGVFGPLMVGIVASVVATACFTDLVGRSLPYVSARWGGVTFALATVVNVVVGRVAFAAGLACALVAVWVWQRGWRVVAVAFAFLTPLASPVAASFLAIAAASVFIHGMWREAPRGGADPVGDGAAPRDGAHEPPASGLSLWARICRMWPALAVGAAAAAPLLLMTVLVGSDGGTFPFRGGHFFMSLLVLAATWVVVPNHIVRIGVAISVAASVVLFVIPTPLGGNFVRLAQFVAVPLAVAGAVRLQKRGEQAVTAELRAVLIAGALAGAVWTLQHAVVAAAVWEGDPSTDRAFHQPLIDEVIDRNADGEPLGRLEIPFTANHWETLYVADQVPYARGWERQIDLSRNAVLYSRTLSADSLREWANTNGVRWFALPDVPLDRGGLPEADVLNNAGGRTGETDWLELVWQNDDWRLYEVFDHQPIVDEPATLVSQSPDEIVISTTKAATVTVRYRFQAGTTIRAITGGSDGAEPCLTETTDGWTSATLPAAGTYLIRVGAGSLLPGANAEALCDPN